MLSDSHCHLSHLDLSSHGGTLNNVLAAARQKDVEYILNPCVCLEEFDAIIKIEEMHSNIFAAIGVHPTEENVRYPSLDELICFGQNKNVVAVGETGLDFYYCKDELARKRQEDLFRLHVKAAKVLNKPLIVHSRDAEIETMQILVEENASKVGGVLHCFTGSKEMAQAALDLGFYISFSGIVTFKNADILREIAKIIPEEKILIETDAPYLAPAPFRGKQNEPAYLPYIAECIAKSRGITHELFFAQTTENFLRFCRV